MRIYIAGQYARKLELREYAKQAEAAGIKVGADWLMESEDPNSSLNESTEAVLAKYAQKDYWDIGACDAMVFFAEDQNNQPPRGGHHVEFGIALAMGKPILVVGDPENIFHYTPGFHIDFYENWSSALVALENLDMRG